MLRYGVAGLTAGLALLLQVVLIPWFGVELDASPFMMFFAAVMIVAYVGGLEPGLLATVVSALASDYFFLFPQYTFWLDSSGQGLRLMIFVLEGALISLLVEAMRSARGGPTRAPGRPEKSGRACAGARSASGCW